MKTTGVNMNDVKLTNRSCVLELLLTHGAMSRTDIAAALHLTTATLTSICNEFLEKNILIQSNQSQETQNVGRKKYPLQINHNYKYVIAIDLHYTGSTIAITNLNAEPLLIESVAMEENIEPRTFLKSLANSCIRLLWENNLTNDDILGVGVSIVGSVNHIDGISLHPFKIFSDAPIAIKEILEEELPFVVCVENNVNAYLNGELLFGHVKNATNMLIIKWGPGVGSASSINGSICKGTNYHSVELGHTYVYSNAEKCQCGRTGCLETGIGIKKFIDKIQESKSEDQEIQKAIVKHGEPALNNIMYFLELNSPKFQEFILSATHDLAIASNNAIQIFSPDCVILYGNLFESSITFQNFTDYILQINPFLKKNLFVKSKLGARQKYVGAATTAIKTFFIDAMADYNYKPIVKN